MRRTLLFGERIIPGFSIPNAFPSYFPCLYFNEAFALCQKGKRSNFLQNRGLVIHAVYVITSRFRRRKESALFNPYGRGRRMIVYLFEKKSFARTRIEKRRLMRSAQRCFTVGKFLSFSGEFLRYGRVSLFSLCTIESDDKLFRQNSNCRCDSGRRARRCVFAARNATAIVDHEERKWKRIGASDTHRQHRATDSQILFR